MEIDGPRIVELRVVGQLSVTPTGVACLVDVFDGKAYKCFEEVEPETFASAKVISCKGYEGLDGYIGSRGCEVIPSSEVAKRIKNYKAIRASYLDHTELLTERILFEPNAASAVAAKPIAAYTPIKSAPHPTNQKLLVTQVSLA